MTFKIGDKVRRKFDAGRSANVEPGQEYIVNFVSDCGQDIGVEGDSGAPWGQHHAANFHLVLPQPVAAKQHYGLQAHSVGGPFPFIVVGIDNPTGLEPGLYWYVQDATGKRCTVHTKSCDKAGTWAAAYAALDPDTTIYSVPDIALSEGYIVPKPATITLPFEVVAAVDKFFGDNSGGDWCAEIMALKAAFKAAYPD